MGLDFGETLTEIFESLGQEALYVPYDGAQKTVTVLPSQQDEIRGAAQMETMTLEVLRSDIPAFTKGKDKIVYGSTTYIVQQARIKDGLRLVWQVSLYEEKAR